MVKSVMKKIVLRLYVTGETPRSNRAMSEIQKICSEAFEAKADLEVINVLEHPQLAEDEKILATPTLIRKLPDPVRRLIGDFSDKEKVLLSLDLLEMGERE